MQQTPISNFPNELLAGSFGNGHMVFRPEASFNMWPKNVGQDLVLMIRNTTTLTLHKKAHWANQYRAAAALALCDIIWNYVVFFSCLRSHSLDLLENFENHQCSTTTFKEKKNGLHILFPPLYIQRFLLQILCLFQRFFCHRVVWLATKWDIINFRPAVQWENQKVLLLLWKEYNFE